MQCMPVPSKVTLFVSNRRASCHHCTANACSTSSVTLTSNLMNSLKLISTGDMDDCTLVICSITCSRYT